MSDSGDLWREHQALGLPLTDAELVRKYNATSTEQEDCP